MKHLQKKKNENKRLFLTSLAFVFWSNKMGPQQQCNACAFVFSNDILFYPYQQLKIPRFLGDLQGTVAVNFGAIECILKEDWYIVPEQWHYVILSNIT